MTDKRDQCGPDPEVVRLALHVAKEAIQNDLHDIDHQHSELDRSIRLGVATLGALLVLIGVFATIRYVPSTLEVFVLGAGRFFNLLSIAIWVVAKTGIHSAKDVATGPDLHDLVEGCKGLIWTVAELRFSLLETYARNGDENQRFINSLADGKRIGVLFWLVAVLLYLLAFTLMLRVNLDG